jgi:hypothetical protein
VASTIVIPPVVSARLAARPEQVADYCRRRQIGKLALFGSILRDDFGVSSDVGVLVSFSSGARPGLFDLAQMEEELQPWGDHGQRRHVRLGVGVPPSAT